MAHWVTLARIVKPRGVKGEVVAEAGDWTPDQLLGFQGIILRPGEREVKLQSAWRHQDRMVLKLQGIESPEEAQSLRNCELCISREERPPAPEGEVYFSDLTGCIVIEEETGLELGTVTDCLEYGGPILLQVKGPDDKEILIPFVKAICHQVDVEAKKIVVVLPEGLKDL